jgi:hypothetical protein
LPFLGGEKSYLHVCRLENDRCAKDTLDTIKASCRCSDHAQGQYALDAFITRQQPEHGHGGEQGREVGFAFDEANHRARPRR